MFSEKAQSLRVTGLSVTTYADARSRAHQQRHDHNQPHSNDEKRRCVVLGPAHEDYYRNQQHERSYRIGDQRVRCRHLVRLTQPPHCRNPELHPEVMPDS